MPGYADIGGSWRGLTGGGYANIGGSWRQITAGYQNRGGTWEKVFPNYADYGDIVKLYGSGYITIGYAYRDSRGLYTGTNGTINNNSIYCGTSLANAVYLWFPTQQTMDLRAYNYAAVLVHLSIYGPYSSTFQSYPRPFFALSGNTSGDPSSDTIIYGSETQISTPTYGNNEGADVCIFIDLSNCTSQDKYLKFGLQVYTQSYTGSNMYPRMNIYDDIYLYKNKSDCNIDTSGCKATWTLTY